MSPRPSGEILGRRLSCAAVDPCRSRGERFDRTRGYNPRVARSRTTYGSNNEANDLLYSQSVTVNTINLSRRATDATTAFQLRPQIARRRGLARDAPSPTPREDAREDARVLLLLLLGDAPRARDRDPRARGRRDRAPSPRAVRVARPPIMRARRWRVATLLEMKPEQRDRVGDNYNRGERVRIKLRNPASDTGWYDLGHVVLVMLHELVHNDIGPHDRAFFKVRADADADDFLTSSSQTRRRPQPPRARFDSFRFVLFSTTRGNAAARRIADARPPLDLSSWTR